VIAQSAGHLSQEDRVEMFLELCRQRTRDVNLDPVVARLSQALRVGEPDRDDIGVLAVTRS
jgi:hypothetical protein